MRLGKPTHGAGLVKATKNKRQLILLLPCLFAMFLPNYALAQSPLFVAMRNRESVAQADTTAVRDAARDAATQVANEAAKVPKEVRESGSSLLRRMNGGPQSTKTRMVYTTAATKGESFSPRPQVEYGADAITPSFSNTGYSAGGFGGVVSSGCGPAISGLNRVAVCPRCGVDEAGKCCCDNGSWGDQQPMQFDQFGQGEYIGPHRPHHVTRYRLRVDDQVNLVYRLTRDLDPGEYEFNVGDTLLVEGETLTGGGGGDDEGNNAGFERNLVILPDGTVTLPLIGQVRAAGRTVQQLRKEIQERSKKWYKFALWTVTPVDVDTRLQDLRAAVDARAGQGGQSIDLRVSPDGTIQPPALGSVCVQGLTLDEAKFEIDQRYAQAGFRGIEISPILTQRAPTFIYVLGEVAQSGRFQLERPTTVMGAISLAGSWNIGGNLRQVIVFRRADDWRLVATKLNLQGALMGNHPTPADEIFLRDSDIVLVPKRPIQRIDDAINLIFTQGLNPMITFGSAVGALDLTFAN